MLAELRGLDVSIAERQDTPGAAVSPTCGVDATCCVNGCASTAGPSAAPPAADSTAGIGEVRAALGDAALVSYLDLPDG